MDSLAYPSSSEDDLQENALPKSSLVRFVEEKRLQTFDDQHANASDSLKYVIHDNNDVAQLPINPFTQQKHYRNHMSGLVEQHAINSQTFNTLHHSYSALGYTIDPSNLSNTTYLGSKEVIEKYEGKLINEINPKKPSKKRLKTDKSAASASWLGPWYFYFY